MRSEIPVWGCPGSRIRPGNRRPPAPEPRAGRTSRPQRNAAIWGRCPYCIYSYRRQSWRQAGFLAGFLGPLTAKQKPAQSGLGGGTGQSHLFLHWDRRCGAGFHPAGRFSIGLYRGCASAREGRLKIGLQDKILPHHWPVLAVQAASHLSYARGSLAAAALLHLAHKSGYCGPVGIFPMDHGEVIAIMNGNGVGLFYRRLYRAAHPEDCE